MAPGEPHFFATDIAYHAPRTITRDDYLGLFSGAGDERLLGEKSVYYLLSKEAARKIKACNPSAKIVVLLRNPVDMLCSLHATHYARTGFENIKSLESAIRAEPERRNGQRIPVRARFPEALYYSEIAKYSEQVCRYLEHFPREKLHFIIFDDLTANPEDEFRKLLEFLGVAENYKPEFSVYNERVMVRSAFLRDVMKSPALRKRVASITPGIMGSGVRYIARAVSKWNYQKGGTKPLKPEVRRRIAGMFSSDIERLSRILDRDLTYWIASEDSSCRDSR